MVEEILSAVFGDKYNQTRFPVPPAGTYAVWTDDTDTDGPDDMAPMITHHDVTIEVYAPKPDPAAEAALEAAMSASGLKWSKEDRYWLTSEKLYQTVYDFSYTEKRRV